MDGMILRRKSTSHILQEMHNLCMSEVMTKCQDNIAFFQEMYDRLHKGLALGYNVMTLQRKHDV